MNVVFDLPKGSRSSSVTVVYEDERGFHMTSRSFGINDGKAEDENGSNAVLPNREEAAE